MMASNEALAIAVEEMRCANEELNAMNEQLQAGREQLLRLTEVLQQRNEALDGANDDLLNFLASVDVPIVIVDSERRIKRYLRSNELVQLTDADIGRPIGEIHTHVDAPELDAWIARVIETARPAEYEVCDREGRWHRLQIQPYRAQGKRLDGALISLVDIDALKRALGEANSARDRMRTLFETVPLPIVVLDDALRIESVNRSFCEFARGDGASLVGQSFLEVSRPRHPEVARSLLDATCTDGRPLRDVEAEYRPLEGSHRLVLLDGCRIPSNDGHCSLLLVLRDVTERRRREIEQERARAESAQRFLNEAGRLLLSVSLESDSTLEKLAQLAVPALGDFCVIDVVADDRSIRTATMAHIDGQDAVPADPLDALAFDADSLIAGVARNGRSMLEPTLDQASLSRIGGARARLLEQLGMTSCLCVPLPGRSAILGALSLARRRSDSRYGRDDLALAEGLAQRAGLAIENAQLYRAAHEAIQLRDEFLGIASHELRTPLTALTLQLENLQKQWTLAPDELPSRKSVSDKLGRAVRHTQRLDRLINSLLSVSRITAGRFALQLEDVDLGQVAREVVDRMQLDAERAGCRLALHADAGVVGRWDGLRLEQVVTNLLTNAFRYASGTPVKISVTSNEKWATLRVEDLGPGVAPDRRPHIFNRYEIAGERTAAGLGLGLYIVRQIVEAHGGNVRLDTDRHVGSAFVVELPRRGPPEVLQ